MNINKRIATVVFCLVLCSVFLVKASTPKFHLVIFGDTNDQSIGQAVSTDVQLLEDYMNEIKPLLSSEGVDYKEYKYIGNNCSPKKLNAFIEKFSCTDDIVLFYYNGHGGRSHRDETKFPRMCLGSNYADEWVKVSDLRVKLQRKQPRLQVIITDCCNSFYDRKATQDYELSAKKLNERAIKQLFLYSKGDACITAASPGEYGWCISSGSYMTIYAINLLRNLESLGNNANWETFFKKLSDETYNKTKELYNARYITNSQRPVYDVNVVECGGDNNPPSDNEISDNDRNNDIDTNRYYNDVIDDYGDEPNSDDNRRDSNVDVEEVSGYSFSIGTLFIMLLGILLVVKVPSWLDLSNSLATIVRCIGIFLILNTILEILY